MQPTARGIAAASLLIIALFAIVGFFLRDAALADAHSPLAAAAPLECEVLGPDSPECRAAAEAAPRFAAEAQRTARSASQFLIVLAVAAAGCVVVIAQPVHR